MVMSGAEWDLSAAVALSRSWPALLSWWILVGFAEWPASVVELLVLLLLVAVAVLWLSVMLALALCWPALLSLLVDVAERPASVVEVRVLLLLVVVVVVLSVLALGWPALLSWVSSSWSLLVGVLGVDGTALARCPAFPVSLVGGRPAVVV